MQRSSVVLPHPLGPTMQAISSSYRSSVRSSNATTPARRKIREARSIRIFTWDDGIALQRRCSAMKSATSGRYL